MNGTLKAIVTLLATFSGACWAQTMPDARSVTLSGPVAERRVSTPLGPMIVRWPRSVEECFGRSPSRAVADAAQTVSRALAQARFDTKLKSGRREWSLLFLDRATTTAQFPAGAMMSRHPGFMMPPNKIYIVADSVTGGCGKENRSAVSDEMLARVLVHEMAHVLEFILLQPAGIPERYRAEGFATWFEGYAADKSQLMNAKAVRESFRNAAAMIDVQFTPEGFNGTFEHYARASMYFNAIVARRGIGSLMDIYELMGKDSLTFFSATEKTISWNRATLEREVKKLLK